MSIRFCVYRGCENYSVNGIIIGDYTIFQFPKDPEKQQKWINLAKVHKNVQKKDLYMCSEHFDKKYLSVNSRRTILLGDAMPFPCETNISNEEDQNECSKEEMLDDDYDDDDNNGDDNVDEDDYEDEQREEDTEELEILNANFQRQFNGEKTDDEQDDFGEEKNIKFELHVQGISPDHDNQNDNYDNDPIDAKRTRRTAQRNYKYSSSEQALSSPSPPPPRQRDNKKYSNKRKQNIYEKSRSPSLAMKRSKLNSQEETSYFSKKLRKTTAEATDEITEYVHKNVYWIKMPKDVYMKERNYFLTKIKKYEMLLNSLKTQIETMDN